MPFDKPKSAASIGRIELRIVGEPAGIVGATMEVQLLAADGSMVRVHEVTAWTELTAAQRTALTTLMGNMRTRAGAEIV